MLGDDARERDRQVVPQGEIRPAARLVLAALEDLEDELVALFPVLAQERLEVLHRRRLERLVPVPLVHRGDDANDVLATAHLVGQKVAHAARRLGFRHKQKIISMTTEGPRNVHGRPTEGPRMTQEGSSYSAGIPRAFCGHSPDILSAFPGHSVGIPRAF